MKHLTLLALVAMTLACNPVKQVLKSESKTQQVIEAYIKTHPFKNDTILTIVPGDTIVTEKTDTVQVSVTTVEKDTVRVTKTNIVTRLVERRITDTVRETVNNYDFVDALRQENIRKDERNKQLTESLAEKSKESSNRNKRFWGLAIAVGLYVGYRAYKFFKPTINVNTT